MSRPAKPADADKKKKGAQEPERLGSIDAYRGFVMFLMLAEVLRLCAVSKALPGSAFWSFLCWHQTHVEWTGCTLHDLIQPGFSFLVGVALPFSLASRRSQGQSLVRLSLHAAWRAAVLVALGIFLRSVGRPITYFTFEDTLTQIGLGYLFLFLLGLGSPRWQWSAFVLLLCSAGLEVALRLAGYGNLEIYDPDPLLFWRLRPNQDAFTKIDHKPVHVNGHGTRGPEFSDAKPDRKSTRLSSHRT